MKNEQILDSIYQDVKALGLVNNQWDFSIMCGRTPAWFSCIKARNLLMTTDAVLTLSHNIRMKAQNTVDESTYAQAVALSDKLVALAQTQIEQKMHRLSL